MVIREVDLLCCCCLPSLRFGATLQLLGLCLFVHGGYCFRFDRDWVVVTMGHVCLGFGPSSSSSRGMVSIFRSSSLLRMSGVSMGFGRFRWVLCWYVSGFPMSFFGFLLLFIFIF